MLRREAMSQLLRCFERHLDTYPPHRPLKKWEPRDSVVCDGYKIVITTPRYVKLLIKALRSNYFLQQVNQDSHIYNQLHRQVNPTQSMSINLYSNKGCHLIAINSGRSIVCNQQPVNKILIVIDDTVTTFLHQHPFSI